MTRRLTLAVDCDDVLVPTAAQIINAYNRDYGTKLGLEHFYQPVDLDSWGTEEERVAIERIGIFLRSPEHAEIEPSPEAIEAIGRLALKHELHVVTGRADFLDKVTKAMLDRYFSGCFQSIEHTNYYDGSTSRTKGEVCAQLEADVLIDDHIIHGESVLASGVKEVIIFGNYPWNRADSLPDGMTRCADWPAVEAEIERIAA